MKKLLLLFLVVIFIGTGILSMSPKPTSANDDLLSGLVKSEARAECITNIAIVSTVSTLNESMINETEFLEDDIETFTIIEDEGTYTSTQDSDTEGSITPFSVSGFKNQIATSDKGSKIIMPMGHFEPLGYCHIYKGHMDKSNGTKKHSATIGGEKKSQFQYPKFPETTMDVIIEVVNETNQLECKDKKNPNRCYKEAYSDREGQKVRVVLHRGVDFAKYSNYNWVVITAYPVF